MLAEYEPYIITVVIMLATACVVYITGFLIILTHFKYEEKVVKVQTLVESVKLYKKEVEDLNRQIDKVIESNDMYVKMALREVSDYGSGK